MRRRTAAAAVGFVAAAVLAVDAPVVQAEPVTPARQGVPARFGPVPETLGDFDSIDSGGPHEPGSAVVNGRLVFAADGGAEGTEVWVSDGTPGGTRLLRDVYAGPGDSDATSFVHQAAKRRRIVLRVQVSATAPLSGTVTLTRRGRVIGTATLVAGQARVRITKRLKAGKHRIQVSYSGSIDAQPSSTRVVVKVRPKRGKG